MYDELVKRLRNHAIRSDSGYEIGNSMYLDILKAADAIEELEKQLHAEKEVCDGYYYAYQHWMHQYIKDIENRVDAKPVDGDKFVDAIIKSYEQSRWIPVTERLPLLNTPVLATDGIEVDIAWTYGVPPRWITSYTAIDEDKLTHWMPLPQTPKGE